jgi:hypothetical protein
MRAKRCEVSWRWHKPSNGSQRRDQQASNASQRREDERSDARPSKVPSDESWARAPAREPATPAKQAGDDASQPATQVKRSRVTLGSRREPSNASQSWREPTQAEWWEPVMRAVSQDARLSEAMRAERASEPSDASRAKLSWVKPSDPSQAKPSEAEQHMLSNMSQAKPSQSRAMQAAPSDWARWCLGKWVVGKKGITMIGYCEVLKPAIVFRDRKKTIKCILWAR